ncbi:MAG: MGH1-like glycoside hydrolase domain-containing protein [Janthinobacterium lividum]
MTIFDTAEGNRLRAVERGAGWRRWGPYVSDRQWGTVREDYSADGDAWRFFPHEHARSRAYRWGEDAIGGFGDDKLHWCLGLALWNGRDPILKERLFGLTNAEGNHGEDVKEVYAYLDGTPTHSYMRMLYRYPQAAYPYAELVAENGRRTAKDPEYELLDTGVFDGDRYFDVVIEYAKASPDDIMMRVTVTNRGPEAAALHLVPQLWARNTWSWQPDAPRPALRPAGPGVGGVSAQHPRMRAMRLDCDAGVAPVFCENDTNTPLLYGASAAGPFKDGINDLVVHGESAAVSMAQGTKCGLPLRIELPAGGSHQMRLRFRPAERQGDPFAWFDARIQARRDEADEFYAALQVNITDPAERLVQRQALAGMLWSKQLYLFDVRRWLRGDPGLPTPPGSRTRDDDWQHVNNADIISMPDTWEYPWYAAWDLAFHCTTFALIDPAFAKAQLVLILREWYMHPNGQIPAYEWNFGDVNPPVHAWAAWHVFEMDRTLTGVPDHAFLERIFHKLMLNFTWWVNRKDADGRNLFQGGFLGLDNIGVFDRSKPLPTGGTLDQADGTAWMAMYCLNLLRIALELALRNPVYEDTATKFFEHFLYITEAMSDLGGGGLWDEQDGFFYDALRLPAEGDAAARMVRLRVRSMVGLIPLMAVEVIGAEVINRLPDFAQRLRWFLDFRPDLASLISRWAEPGAGERRLLSLLRGHRMKKLLERMLADAEFLSPFGIRSLSKAHEADPYVFEYGGVDYTVAYAPGNGVNRLFGGNSNWRGPIWFPVNALLIESLRRFHDYYGDDFLVECPVGSGRMRSLAEVADELRERLIRLFRTDPAGRRPSQGRTRCWPGEPALDFHEFFHGDTGEGLGASHQTGWTGLIALIIQNHADVVAGVKLPADPGGGPATETAVTPPDSPSTLHADAPP